MILYYNPRLDLVGELVNGLLAINEDSEFMVLTKEWVIL